MLWQNPDQDIARAAAASGPDLPTTFGDTFNAAWSRNDMFMQKATGEADRLDALGDYLKTIQQKTGKDLTPELDYGTGEFMPDSRALFRQTNDKVNELKRDFPDLQPMTPEDFEANAVGKRRKADADYGELVGRPRGPGATAGLITGGLAAETVSPINLAALPLAPAESLGIVASALRWGAFGLGAGTASEAFQAPYQEEVQPGYLRSGAPLLNIAEAGLSTAAGGAAFRGVANAWERVRTGAWPTSIKDAGNVVSSHANIIGSNVYSGADGAAAHEQALSKTIDDVLARHPVDVSAHITPELEDRVGAPAIEAARTQAQAAALEATRARVPPAEAAPELPFERTAAEAQAAAAREPLDAGVQQAARANGYDMPAEEAARVSDKLLDGTPEEAQDLMRNMQISPRQVADAPRGIEPPAEPVPTPVTPIVNSHAPEFQTAVRADLDREVAAVSEAAPIKSPRIPVAIDAEGNVTYQSIEKALNEIDGYKTAAEQIAACAAPMSEPTEAV